MGKLSTRVIIAENPYADIDMPEVPSEVPVGSGENISKSICISRGKIVRVTVVEAIADEDIQEAATRVHAIYKNASDEGKTAIQERLFSSNF